MVVHNPLDYGGSCDIKRAFQDLENAHAYWYSIRITFLLCQIINNHILKNKLFVYYLVI